MATGTFSEDGFLVVADNALDLLTGTHAAGAGMISANVQKLGRSLNADLTKVQNTIVSESRRVSGVNQEGFNRLNGTVQSELGNVERSVTTLDSDLKGISKDIKGIEALSAASVAIQAAGFALTVGQLIALRGDVRKMHGELAEQGKQVIELQKLANSHLERLSDFAERTLATQELILETLVTSRTNEAKQLIRQGWDNLKGGFDDDAYSRFIKSLEYDNTVYLTHAELARLCEQRKDDAQAEEHHRRAAIFSESAGAEIKGFAHIQYAAFLERHNRLEECTSQIQSALNCLTAVADQTKRAETEARWRFYLAEIFAKSDDSENAFQELRKSIELDARFFTAAMASESLQRLQPRVSQFLVRVDADHRASVIETLREVSAALPAINILNGKHGEDFKKAAATCLERSLFASFEQIRTLSDEARKLKLNADALPEQISGEMFSQIEDQLRIVETRIKEEPTRKAPDDFEAGSVKKAVSAVLVCSVMAAIIVLSLMMGHFSAENDAYNIRNKVAEWNAEHPEYSDAGATMTTEQTLSAFMLAALAFGGTYFIGRIIVASILNQRTWTKAELPNRRKEWESRVADAVDALRKLKSEKIAVLKKALEKLDSSTLRTAVASIEAIQEPPFVAS